MKTNWQTLTEPTLLLDTRIAKRNLQRMAEKAKRAGVVLNPHFKTHQSAEIGEWFRAAGISRISVSSLLMAEYFAGHGWNDITVLFPVNVRDLSRIKRLSASVSLTLNVISLGSARFLVEEVMQPVNLIVEVEAGYGRTGISVNDGDKIEKLLHYLQQQNRHRFYGFYIHAGHTYDVAGPEEVAEIHLQTLAALGQLKGRWMADFTELKIDMGDTPGCSIMEGFSGIHAIHPGNFIFYDLTQGAVGACEISDIAVCMACPVVAKEESRNEIVVHGGAVHFSKDWLTTAGDSGTQMIFGRPVQLSADRWGAPIPGGFVRKLSQEHGIIRLGREAFEEIQVGDLIGVLPVHSCLTADCMGKYLTEEGELLNMMPWRNRA
ncbi:MAG: alanine racemase [Balneolales bacterium]|nr:alanine racemase [Balneolales bacterium]